MDKDLGKLQEMVRDREAWRATVSLWDHKESDTTGQLNNNNYIWQVFLFIQNQNDQKAPIKCV